MEAIAVGPDPVTIGTDHIAFRYLSENCRKIIDRRRPVELKYFVFAMVKIHHVVWIRHPTVGARLILCFSNQSGDFRFRLGIRGRIQLRLSPIVPLCVSGLAILAFGLPSLASRYPRVKFGDRLGSVTAAADFGEHLETRGGF